MHGKDFPRGDDLTVYRLGRRRPHSDGVLGSVATMQGDPSSMDPALPRTPSILIVDDHPPNRLAIGVVLESLELRLVEASSGTEALRACEGTDFALVLMDIQMPEMDGFQTVEELRRRGKSLPVIFITAGLEHDHARAWQLDAVDLMTKPIDVQALRAKVRTFAALWERGEQVRLQAEAARRAREELYLAEAEAAKAEHARLQAESIGRLRETFISVLAHDLRGPLAAVSMGAQMIAADDAGSDRTKAIASKIGRTSERMSSLITDVLDFARGQLGSGIPVVPLETNMGHVCASVVDEVQMQFPEREITTVFKGDLRGRWDRARVEQAIGNLVVNALQHGDGRVCVLAHGEGPSVVVCVQNFGPTIPADRISTLFDPFHGSSHQAGLGLGLYIVSEIVRAHGARIEVVSDERDGTRFTMSWPREAAVDITPSSWSGKTPSA